MSTARLSRSTKRGNKIAIAFGKPLAEQRKQRGLSQDRFAAISGFHKNSIGMFERGEISPKLEAIVDLAHALDMKSSELLDLLEERITR